MIWSVLYWVLVLTAVVLLLRGLFWDRAGFRGRAKLRCRKCWYDLTGTEGNEDPARRAGPSGPVVCPECGKGHKTTREMRKTRRGKRWVLAAVVLVLGAYAIQIRSRYNHQQLQQLGLVVLVPTPVLIAAVPLMPDEAGSLPDRNSGANALPIKQRPIAERIAQQIKVRLYRAEETSVLDRWMFERFARHQSSQTLTDENCVRGDLFTSVYRALERQGRLDGDEERWARSVHFMELELPQGLPQMAPVHARVSAFRRLLQSRPSRVRIHERVYEVQRGVLLPADLQYRERWDGTVRVAEFLRWANFASSALQEEVRVEGMVFEGDRAADVWWPVAEIREVHRVAVLQEASGASPNAIGAMQGYQLVEDVDAVRSWVESQIDVSFEWVQDPIGNRIGWPRGVEFAYSDIASGNAPKDGFTFGGSILLMAQLEGHEYPEVISSLDPTWWALRNTIRITSVRWAPPVGRL